MSVSSVNCVGVNNGLLSLVSCPSTMYLVTMNDDVWRLSFCVYEAKKALRALAPSLTDNAVGKPLEERNFHLIFLSKSKSEVEFGFETVCFWVLEML